MADSKASGLDATASIDDTYLVVVHDPGVESFKITWSGFKGLLESQLDFVPVARTVTASTGLTGGGALSSNISVAVDFASDGAATAGKAVVATDSRLSDSRTPSTHASTHAEGGADEITPAAIGAAADDHNHDSDYAPLSYTVVTDATTARTLASGDNGKVINFTSGSAVAVSVPDNIGAGFHCELRQGGAGQITVSVTGGGSLRNRQSHSKTAGQYASVVISQTETGHVDLQGDSAA